MHQFRGEFYSQNAISVREDADTIFFHDSYHGAPHCAMHMFRPFAPMFASARATMGL